jgi:hypothetical protein
MANVIYEVMAPDGQTILEIQGPEGAPPEQVQAEAARLYREQLQQRAATTDVPVLDERGQMVQPPAPAPAPAPTMGERAVGAAEALGTLATGVPAMVGQLGGTLGATAASILRGEFGTPQAAQMIAETAAEQAQRPLYVPRTPAGQQAVQAIGQAAEVIPPFVPMAAELGMAGRMAGAAGRQAAGLGREAAVAGREAAAPAVEAMRETGRAIAEVPGAVGEAKERAMATLADIAMPERRAQIAQTLMEQPDSTEVVRFRLVNDQVRPDKPADEALKQGWKEGAVASIKAASDEDRKRMQQMLNVYKLGKKSEKFRAMNRPADILGKSVDNRVKFLSTQRERAGKDIDTIAKKQLRGQQVNYQPAINQFLGELDEIGAKMEMGPDGIARINLRGSDIQGDRQAQRVLNATLERLSDVNAPDAYGVHTAKRFIDTQVNYGKQSAQNPLSRKAESILKNLRRNLNTSLADQFKDYGAANTKYSQTTQALDDLQDAVGTKLDFDSPNAPAAFGTAMRRILSNYGTRANVIDSLDEVNRVASQYGMKLDDDVVNQLIFVNELDRMFGAPADMTFKGQISQAIQTGVDIARGGAAQRAMDLLAEKAESLRGINEENAIKVMEEILARRTPKPTAQPGQQIAPMTGGQ